MPDAPSPMPDPPRDDLLRALFHGAPVAVLVTDAQLRVVAANEAAGRLLGVAPADILGRPMALLVPPDRRGLLERLLQRAAQRNEGADFAVTLPGPGGEVRHLAVVLVPAPDPAGGPAGVAPPGRPVGVAAWILDETRRRHLADRLAQVDKMASLATLARGVAHHFNNILGGVATLVDYALGGSDPVVMKRALQTTAEAIARAAKITQSLLSYAAKDHAPSDLADLTEVLLHFVNLVEKPLAQKSIRLELDLHPVPVWAVETRRLNQVLHNLLDNAEEAMPHGGTVTIALDRAGDEVVLTFADTGCGIDPRLLPRVFEPFFTTKGLLAGGDKVNPGLGLSIVHGIVTEMGGRISVESTPGQSTRFVIALPIHKDSQA